ncbi:alpha/beta hydrolase-fold protein [Paenibacillus sp. Marseille-Q4541]|uniref:alpha/beta hydrolase n=1 Tax=Paenibacillus sp. Marseille-Q4541 TaxID=2831522 RepID=UPI001BA74071|nr:alpha/beta hydrolase-fold protein [Paenibacillus sp. Marseille-Q4541]
MRELYQQEVILGKQISVYLPPSYREENNSTRFQVVYLQDGMDLVSQVFNLLNHKFRTKELPELIFVGIEPTNRSHEYTPWPAPSLRGTAFPGFDGKGAEYIAYITDTLKPHIDHTYRTLIEPEHTGILGASLGGLISLYAGYLRPDVFGKIGALSASLWYESMLSFIETSPLSIHRAKLFLSVGSLEGVYKENIQRHMVTYTVQAHALFLEKGMNSDQLKFVLEEGGTHDDYFFAKQFLGALHWMFASPKEE